MVDTPAKSAETVTVGMLAQRLDGMDKAIELLQELADRQPTPGHVQLAVLALKELTQAKLEAMQALVDAKFNGNQTALDAALKTQKEGADKIESNFTKQLDNVAENIKTLTKSVDDKLNDLKDRFNTSVGREKGLGDGWGYLVGGVGLLATIITIVVVLVRSGGGP